MDKLLRYPMILDIHICDNFYYQRKEKYKVMKERVSNLRAFCLIFGIIGSPLIAWFYGSTTHLTYSGRTYEERSWGITIGLLIISLFVVYIDDTILGALETMLGNQDKINDLLATSYNDNTKNNNIISKPKSEYSNSSSQSIETSSSLSNHEILEEIRKKDNSEKMLKYIETHLSQEKELIAELKTMVSIEKTQGNMRSAALRIIENTLKNS